MGIGGNWELLDAKKMGMEFVLDGNRTGWGMGMKSLKWEGFGTKNLFPHIPSLSFGFTSSSSYK